MSNNWNIPASLEQQVRERDTVCVYCLSAFTSQKISVRSSASWEHIINDVSIITLENIALCCRGCNSSKGQKTLKQWLKTDYCSKHGITQYSVAPVVKNAIKNEL